MFSIFTKKTHTKIDFSALRTDMHSHLLPGIDDGATDVQNSIELINGLEDLGFEKFITTPHILQGMYNNDASTIDAASAILRNELQLQGKEISIHAAAEYYMDDYFDSITEQDLPLLTLKDKMVLVEFSFIAPPVNYKELLFRLQISGHQPVLAHPERYQYLANNKKIFDELKDSGCLFQLNILSLAGYYGRPAMDLARYLISKNYVDLMGTDLHHVRHLHALQNAPQVMSAISNLMNTGRILNPLL